MKRYYKSLAALLIVAVAVISMNIIGGSVNAKDRYCDTNSIIRCGALTAPELQQRYTANATGDLPAIYSHYGISRDMVANAGTAKVGQIGKNGQIVLNGKVIATNTQSVGREFVKGSTAVKIGNKTIYQRPTQNVFIDQWQTAFIFLKADGTFAAAIIKSCGNPVVATPTPKPKPPLVYKCTGLSATKITRTQFNFKATRTVQNVRYIRTDLIVRDSTGKEIFRAKNTSGEYTYNQTKTGKFTVEAQIIVDVNGKEAASPVGICKKAFEVTPPPVTPVANVAECTSLQRISTEDKNTFEFKTTARTAGKVTIKDVTVNFGDGKSQTVAYNTNARHTYTPGNYVAIATVNFVVDGKAVSKSGTACKVNINVEKPPVTPECKPGIPEGDERCKEECKPGVPVGDILCEEAPVETPPELPETGVGENITAIAGLGALVTSIGYYVASRRSLNQ